jgi:hypothetical protein
VVESHQRAIKVRKVFNSINEAAISVEQFDDRQQYIQSIPKRKG